MEALTAEGQAPLPIPFPRDSMISPKVSPGLVRRTYFLFPSPMLAAGVCPLNPNEPGSILITVLETPSCSPATFRS